MALSVLRVLAIAFLLIASPLVSAQSSKPPQENAPSAEVSPLESQLSVLSERLDSADQSTDKILQVVYWSLATCITIAILLVGYGWFSNFKIYERDKLTLERELKSLFKEQADATEASLRSAIKDSEKSLKELVGFELRRATSSQLSSMKSEIKDVLSLVNGLRLESKTQERKGWLAKNLHRNALATSVEALVIAIELDDDFQVGDVLDLISQDMTSCTGRAVDNFLVGQLVEALDNVKGHHAQSAANLKQRAPLLGTPA